MMDANCMKTVIGGLSASRPVRMFLWIQTARRRQSDSSYRDGQDGRGR